jgi:uncharacterized protein (TIGR00297 family)
MSCRSETARTAVHFGVGGLAFLLAYLTPLQAALLAAAGIAFNRFLVPRIGGDLIYRQDELASPWRSGIILYPTAVLLLIVLFHDRLEVAAAGWAIMAAGDGAAGFVGRRIGRRPIPWNRSKSLEGFAACALASGISAWAILVWMGRGPLEAAFLAAPTCLFAAFVESLPWRLDDNLTVPLLSALFLRGLLEVDPARLREAAEGALPGGFASGVLVNLGVAALFRRAGLVDGSGTIAGFLIGVLTWTFAGWEGFVVLLSFFVLGSAATRLGYRRKERAGIAQEKKGARSARHALANCGVSVYLAFLIATAASPAAFILAFVCAYATAAFDTVSSEVGQAYGGEPVLITTLRRVPAGTNGAVSWLGTLAGALAALAVAGVAALTGIFDPGLTGIVLVAAFIGSTADSLLGATLEQRGLMDNEAVNFTNTLVGSLAGIGLAALMAAPV